MANPRDLPLDSLQFYLTAPYPCSYLDQHEARSQVLSPNSPLNRVIYSALVRHGFRRSGGFTYRPYCDLCQACVPVRVNVADFNWRRINRRVVKKNQDLIIHHRQLAFDESHFKLYLAYQQARHPKEESEPDSKEQYIHFLIHSPVHSELIEFRLEEQVVMVSVVDYLEDGLSSVYTFFDPTLEHRSLGQFNILWQLEQCRTLQLPWLYLGYWIKESRKMNYKIQYQPLEGLINDIWQPLVVSSQETL
ncbi:MAG: arginyltransferase [Ferrovum sp. 37-45-19]|jgi:arginine-tRNA-protein transferase|uniref:arginyltransferase n=1 Tax=Ferrovum sp. JA12 TaxID=1356299 RepID=UPI000702EC7D|nr:arginyltransferase [Ferrovum sp. JA12]OYV79312.1 MAG: arginyltransferase [Ferrovum sp. 21-44-67]OYV94133.1 MAG: arginyltransferase [Ferrovum sp. 37-45-19]OZB34309.1 MAG: arginyltransferase [Ferrovum sp. 34-44-207]HQT81399.1 arginyltransferase [Ferrovaceae bacterium]KRH78510.1 putative arginyl-tRNA--protein transferase [Ferrovum sp. JA12]